VSSYSIISAGDGSTKIRGCWDSIHVVEVQVIIITIIMMMTLLDYTGVLAFSLDEQGLLHFKGVMWVYRKTGLYYTVSGEEQWPTSSL